MIGLDLGVSFVRRFITGIFWSFPLFPIIIKLLNSSRFLILFWVMNLSLIRSVIKQLHPMIGIGLLVSNLCD